MAAKKEGNYAVFFRCDAIKLPYILDSVEGKCLGHGGCCPTGVQLNKTTIVGAVIGRPRLKSYLVFGLKRDGDISFFM